MVEVKSQTSGSPAGKSVSCVELVAENNPLYQDIEISVQNLQSLPVDDVLPYHIEEVEANDAQEVLVSRYDNVNDCVEPSDERRPELQYFESVTITDVDAHTPAGELTAAAVRHVKEK
jgi:hypothetical protein